MNVELKQKWLEALRSGALRQGRLQLRTQDDRFCCLGVLCHIVDPNGWSSRGQHDGFRHSVDFSGHCESDDLVPAVGISQLQCSTLVRMNDGDGCDFAEIADWIEANIPADAA